MSNQNAKTSKQFNGLVTGVKAVIESAEVAGFLGGFDAFLGEIRSEEVKKEIDTDYIFLECASRVSEFFIGALPYNVHNGVEKGAAQIDKADAQFRDAYASYKADIATNGEADEKTERRVVGRMEWLVRMRVQQGIREALLPYVNEMYAELTGEAYNHVTRTQKTAAKLDDKDESIAFLSNSA